MHNRRRRRLALGGTVVFALDLDKAPSTLPPLASVTRAADGSHSFDDETGFWIPTPANTPMYWGGMGLVVNGARTQLQGANTNDLTVSPWSGDATATLDQTGLTGAANGATLLTDDNASAYETRDRSSITVADATMHCIDIITEVDADVSSFPAFRVNFGGGDHTLVWNKATGAYDDSTGLGGFAEVMVTRMGPDWWIQLWITSTSTGTTKFQFFPAIGINADLTTFSDAATGSVVVKHVGMYATARWTWPVIGAASRAADQISLGAYPDDRWTARVRAIVPKLGAAGYHPLLGIVESSNRLVAILTDGKAHHRTPGNNTTVNAIIPGAPFQVVASQVDQGGGAIDRTILLDDGTEVTEADPGGETYFGGFTIGLGRNGTSTDFLDGVIQAATMWAA